MSLLDAVRVASAALSRERRQPDRPARNDDELAFLPAALEIMETPASPQGRRIAWSIMAFFALAVAWATVGELDIHATAPGALIPVGKTRIIQAPEPAVVTDIRVKDGDIVAEDQVLVRLDPSAAAAEVERLKRERIEAEATVARLRAQLDGMPLDLPEGFDATLIEVHRLQLEARVAEHQALMEGLKGEHDQRKAELAALRLEIEGLEKSLPLLQEIEDMRLTLERTGSGSKLQLLVAKGEVVAKRAALDTSRARLIQTAAAIEGAEQRRRQAEKQFRADTLRDLAEAERKAATLAAELRKAASRVRQLTLRAPVHGVVQQLAVHSEGAVVTQAQPVLSVVPLNEGLEIEAALPNKDVAFVLPGQDAELKVEAFPFTRFGTIAGAVVHVSRDAVALADGGRGAQQPANAPPGQGVRVYTVRIRPAQTHVQTADGDVALTPGMEVTAEIKTGKRKVIDYLLAPLLRYRDESLNER